MLINAKQHRLVVYFTPQIYLYHQYETLYSGIALTTLLNLFSFIIFTDIINKHWCCYIHLSNIYKLQYMGEYFVHILDQVTLGVVLPYSLYRILVQLTSQIVTSAHALKHFEIVFLTTQIYKLNKPYSAFQKLENGYCRFLMH